MKIKIEYNKLKKIYIIKINKKLLFNYYIKKKNNYNYSSLNYNYNIILKLLRICGLIKPIYNYKDYLNEK